MIRIFGAALSLALLAVASAASAEVTQIRIGLQFGLSYLPVVVAQSENMIAKRAAELGIPNLEVKLERFSGSTAMNEAMLSNSIDLGTLGTAGALIIWDKTRGRGKIKSLCGVAVINYVLFANRPELKSLSDFSPNDKIAVPAFNSPQAILLRIATERMMGDKAKADLLMVNLPHPDATASLLAGSTIAGYFATPPFSQVLARDPRIHPVLTSRDLLDGKDATATTLIASQAFVDDNPKVSRAILAGMEDAMALISQDPKRAAAIYLSSEKVPISAAEIVSILTDGSTSFAAAPEGIVAYAKFMAGQNFLKTVPADWKETFFPLIGNRPGS